MLDEINGYIYEPIGKLFGHTIIVLGIIICKSELICEQGL